MMNICGISRFVHIFITIVPFSVLTGCAGLNLQMTDVVFEDPVAKLGILEVEPTAEENAGILLRIFPPDSGTQNSREESKIYAKVKNGKGVQVQISQLRTDQYSSGSREDSYVVKSVSRFEKNRGEIVEEIEITTRGEIVEFIQGRHQSKIGDFEIVEWTRTPAFPEKAVKIGDVWTYEELMDVRLKSRLVEQQKFSPYVIKARSQLKGFAEVLGRRCAVLETHTFQRKEEHLKVLFKEVTLDIYSDIVEFAYLDYKSGTLVARVVTIESRTTSPDAPILDHGRGQSVYSIL